jgi:arylsulfatase
MKRSILTSLPLLALALPTTAQAQDAAAVAATAQAEPTPSIPAAQALQPNVLVWMLDDVGFAQLSSFGGLVPTPNIDRVARMGLRYSNYHTAPVCSAARASFLTGRMPHSVNVGSHVAVARPVPGYNGRIPASAGTIADNLRAAGYTTLALGKWDHILNEESTPAGPYRQWPTGQGFDRFYGFLSADTDNFHPALVRDQTPVRRPPGADYHLTSDIADEAIAMIRDRESVTDKRPFFAYWATGVAHAPHHAPQAWIDRFKGKFDIGWDKVREDILDRQKAAALVPEHTQLAPRPDGMPAWDELSEDRKRLYARQMEVFAAALAHADAEFGRILDTLEATGELDNTMVIITSDNGASADGAWHGMFTEAILARGRPGTVEENLAFYDRWGGPESYPNYSFGWAVAGNTPFRYYKHTTHEGGTRVPFVISWPAGIAARGELRSQFAHVSDVAPTILDAAGIPLAERVNNVEQSPMEGISFAHTFGDNTARSRKDAQYFEMFGNKGLWSQGWTIVTTHKTEPWDMAMTKPIDEAWELYNLEADPGQTQDLSGKFPERVAEMNRLFEEQAVRYHVNPIGNMAEGLQESGRKARAAFAKREGVWRYSGPVTHIQSSVAPPVFAAPYTMRAKLDLPTRGTTGPVFAIGGTLGGMALYLRDGRPVFALNTIHARSTEIAARRPLDAGPVKLELDFQRQRGPGPAQVTIRADGKIVAQDVVQAEDMADFMVFEHFGVGIDIGTPVLRGMTPETAFPGTIDNIEFDFRAPAP